MALEVGTPLKLDVGPALQAIDRITAADSAFRVEQQKTSASVNTSYAEMARQATAYSDSLKRQQDEVRGAAAATRSAVEEVRRLTAANVELAAAAKKSSSADEAKRLGQEIAKNTAKIKEAKQAIQDNKAATDQERAAVLAITEARRQEVNQTKLASATAKDLAAAAKQEASAAKEAAAANKEKADASKGVESGGSLLDGIAGKAGGVLAGIFAVEKIAEYADKIREVTAEFEKYEITLTGAFNGDRDRAQRAIVQVQAFADAQGLDIESLTDTYVKLVNRGIIPTTNQLRQLSDIAATSGKSTDQFVEALLDAQTGEFERLKEFGIKVKNNGDTISFSFRGVKTEVKNTQDAISQYLFALGDANGVQGQAAAQLKSLGGAAADSKNALTELYLVLGDRAKGAFSGFSNVVAGAARGLANFFKSADRIALEQSAAGIDNYARLVGVRFAQVAADAKASGKDVNEALRQTSDDQVKFIDIKLKKAQQELKAFYQSTAESGVEDTPTRGRLEGVVKLYEGQRKAAQQAYQAAIDGGKAEMDQVGRIAALRLKIASEEKARDAAPDTNAGDKERVRLVAQLVVDNKLLNELLGKQDKASAAAADKLAAALRALYSERATLQSLAAKASIKDSDDQAARAKATFDESLRQTQVLQQKLVEREAAVKKAGGRGANADGVIDGTQEKALSQLRIAALDQYYSDLYKITEAREQRLFELRDDSDAKQLEAINRKYDALIKANTDGIEREAIEEARQREQLALKASQEQRRIDQIAQAGQNNAATVGLTFGEGTGISVIEAKRAEQQALLDIEKKAAEDSLNNTLNRTGKEAEIERTALRAQLARIQQQQVALNREKSAIPAEDIFFKAIFGEQDSDENRQKLKQITEQFAGALNETAQAAERAADLKISAYDRSISELSNSLAAEIQLNQAGSASNIKGIQDQIAEEKLARQEAIAEKKRAQKEEAIINAAQQGSALLTAAANLILGWSELPLVGQVLGALSVAAMLASFYAAQSSIGAATAGSFFVGGYTGDGNEREVSTAQGRRPYEYHKREFIMRHELTDQYRYDLFEPLHLGRPQDIKWDSPTMQALLPDLDLPDKLRQERAESLRVQHEHTFAPMKQDFDRLHARLEAIENSNREMADKKDMLPLGNGRIVEIGKNGSTHIRNIG